MALSPRVLMIHQAAELECMLKVLQKIAKWILCTIKVDVNIPVLGCVGGWAFEVCIEQPKAIEN
jgi:hypothetical protein